MKNTSFILTICIFTIGATLLQKCVYAQSISDNWLTVVSVLLHDEALARAHDVELYKDLAFVPGKGGSIAIVDIKNQSNPKIIWYKNDPDYIPDSEAVLSIGDMLILGTRDFLVLDVKDAYNPKFLNKISNRPYIDRINGFTRFDSIIFTANKSGYISAIDVSNPEDPSIYGILETKQNYKLNTPHDIDSYGDYIVITDPNGFSPPYGRLGIFKVLDGGIILPSDQWSLVGKIESWELIGANRVHVSGDYAIVSGSITPRARKDYGNGRSQISIIDISDASNPTIVASLPSKDDRGPNGLTVSGNIVFSAGGQTIEAYEITNPKRPLKIGSQSFPIYKESDKTDNYHDLVYLDGYLYVSAQTDNGFIIMKVNDEKIRYLAEGKQQE